MNVYVQSPKDLSISLFYFLEMVSGPHSGELIFLWPDTGLGKDFDLASVCGALRICRLRALSLCEDDLIKLDINPGFQFPSSFSQLRQQV